MLDRSGTREGRGVLKGALSFGCLLFAGVPPAPAQTPVTVPDGFVHSAIITNFPGRPVDCEFLPDGRLLVIELNNARVSLATADFSSWSSILTIPNVDVSSFTVGLSGVAIDPGWPARPYLYFFYTHVDTVSYVTMYTASGDLTDPASTNVTLASPYHILTDIPNNDPAHQSGCLEFGPDGMLYVSLGDDEDRCSAQDLTVLGGMILRLDVSSLPGAGSGPPAKSTITPANGNPYPGPNENELLAYVQGLRNPFRFDIDPLSGDLLIGDAQDRNWEEVDFTPASSPGQNYGWPVLEALMPTPYCAPSCACSTDTTLTDPILIYAHPDPGTFGPAIIGGPVYYSVSGSPTSLPWSYDGDYFFADWGLGFLRRAKFGASGWELAPPVAGQPATEDWAQGVEQVVDIEVGPDGALYLVLLTTDGAEVKGVHRIARDPSIPTAVEAGAPSAGPAVTASPNPARAAAGATIRWSTPAAQRLEISVYDASGRLVSSLLPGERKVAASGAVHWDGRGQDGKLVPAGVYFYRMRDEAGGELSGKLTLLR